VTLTLTRRPSGLYTNLTRITCLYIPDVQLWTSQVKAFESYRLTDIHTYRQTRLKLYSPRRFAGGQQKGFAAKKLIIFLFISLSDLSRTFNTPLVSAATTSTVGVIAERRSPRRWGAPAGTRAARALTLTGTLDLTEAESTASDATHRRQCIDLWLSCLDLWAHCVDSWRRGIDLSLNLWTQSVHLSADLWLVFLQTSLRSHLITMNIIIIFTTYRLKQYVVQKLDDVQREPLSVDRYAFAGKIVCCVPCRGHCRAHCLLMWQ